jgi:hypothetical protein
MNRERFECLTTNFFEIQQMCQFFQDYLVTTIYEELRLENDLGNLPSADLENVIFNKYIYCPNNLVTFYFKSLSSKTLMVFESNIEISEDLILSYSLLRPLELSKNSNCNNEKKPDWDSFYHIYAQEYVYLDSWNKNFSFVVLDKSSLPLKIERVRNEKLCSSKAV